MTTTNDDHTQEVTDSFTLFDQNTSTYNSERGNTDRKLLGITFDNDLFRGRIDYCNLLLFNSGTSTHYTMENHREQVVKYYIMTFSSNPYSLLNRVKMRLQAMKNYRTKLISLQQKIRSYLLRDVHPLK
uniref:Uncharacterized protein n=2 Tax=Loa loa TaxID=7209 RepID=A0A1I7V677_LOALO